MGIRRMDPQFNAQLPIPQPSSMMMEKSLHSLSLGELEIHLGNLGKPLGSMNLDELLENVWYAEARHSTGTNVLENTSSSSTQRYQAGLSVAMLWSGKIVDQIWMEIGQNRRNRYVGENCAEGEERELTLGEVTLEDFLEQAGLFHTGTLSTSVDIDSLVAPFNPSVNVFSGSSSSGRRRDIKPSESSIDKKLRRKIKNRESAARSRARKQAYQNELLNKVTQLEATNKILKKTKEFDEKFPRVDNKHQLRRTSSAPF